MATEPETAEVIWRDPEQGLVIEAGPAIAPEIIDFLARIVWGSRSLRYTLPDLSVRLARLRAPTVMVLRKKGELVSVCILDRCEKPVMGVPYDAFHFVMLATPPGVRNKGLGGQLIAEARRYCHRVLPPPALGFAYVEETTVYSLRISDRVGHALSAEMPLVLFSRFWPSDDARVGLARPEEREAIVARLTALYADHEFVDFQTSVDTGRYLVLREGGEIVAGVQFERLTWKLVSLPGFLGRVLMYALPWVPFVKDRLKPDRLPLLRFTNLLVEPGREAAFPTLMEAALARQETSLGMFMLDGRCEVLGRVRAHGNLGMLSSMVKGSAVLRADFFGVDDAVIQALRDKPLLPSAADIF